MIRVCDAVFSCMYSCVRTSGGTEVRIECTVCQSHIPKGAEKSGMPARVVVAACPAPVALGRDPAVDNPSCAVPSGCQLPRETGGPLGV